MDARVSNASSTQRQVTFTSTTSWQQVTALPALPVHRVILVENYTDGDIEVAFGSTAYADFIVKQSSDKVVSSQYVGNPTAGQELIAPMYIRNISGTGGTVYIKTMPAGSFASTSRGFGSLPSAIPVSPGGDVIETRYFDASSTNINEVSGAYVAVGAALASSVGTVHVTTTIGEPLDFAIGADCSAPTTKWIVNRGEGPLVIGNVIASGRQICVRSLSAASVSSGEIVLNLMQAP